jgi:hypothetical protein
LHPGITTVITFAPSPLRSPVILSIPGGLDWRHGLLEIYDIPENDTFPRLVPKNVRTTGICSFSNNTKTHTNCNTKNNHNSPEPKSKCLMTLHQKIFISGMCLEN